MNSSRKAADRRRRCGFSTTTAACGWTWTGAANWPHRPHPDKPPHRAAWAALLGVVAREVTLLPRHWEWLNRQPGGASGALRRLVDEARGKHAAQDAVRAATEAAYRFMSEMAGDLPHFEDASRALFAHQADAFARHTATWPEDVRSYLQQLSSAAWSSPPSPAQD